MKAPRIYMQELPPLTTGSNQLTNEGRDREDVGVTEMEG